MDIKVDRVTKVLKDSREIRVLEDSRDCWVTRVQEDTKVTDLGILNFADTRETGVNRDPRAKEVFRETEVSKATEVSRVVLRLDL